MVQAQRLCLTADLLGFLGQLNAFVNANGFDSKGVIPWNMGSLVNGTIKGDMQEFPTYFNYSQEFITVTQTTLL